MNMMVFDTCVTRRHLANFHLSLVSPQTLSSLIKKKVPTGKISLPESRALKYVHFLLCFAFFSPSVGNLFISPSDLLQYSFQLQKKKKSTRFFKPSSLPRRMFPNLFSKGNRTEERRLSFLGQTFSSPQMFHADPPSR